MVGGGVHGAVVGIALIIMIGVGVTITRFRIFIMILTRAGEGTTETVIGTDTAGTMNGFLTSDFTVTGKTGTRIDIGKSKEPGACRAINLGPKDRGRS
jgi:hypothetical protein